MKTGNGLIRIMNYITNFIILNAIFVLTTLPILTIGITIPSALKTCKNIVKDEHLSVMKEYFGELKSNFKSGMIYSVIFVGVSLLLLVNFTFVSNNYLLNQIVNIGGIYLLLFQVWFFFFVFPYFSRYEDSIKNTFKQSAIILKKNIHYYLLELLFWVSGASYILSSPRRLFSFLSVYLFGGAVVFLLLVFIFTDKMFSKYEEKTNEHVSSN